MAHFRIFSDAPFDDAASDLLREGAAPHEILLPQSRASSVLASPTADPQFPLADIAFGQPAIASIRESERLKWLQISSAGFARYDTPEFRALVAERGFAVTNSSAVYATACAEHVFAFLLAQSRLLPHALRSRAPNGSVEWARLRAGSVSPRGQNVVILGFGGIAREVMKLLAPFQMNVTAMRRHPRGDEGCPTVTEAGLAPVLAAADHVINMLPDNAASQNFIDAHRLGQMKPGSVLYNIGRGTTVNQQALLEALRSGHLAAAWLDVTDPEPLPSDHPLRAEPHCFMTPHIAGGHAGEATTLVRHFLANLRRFEAGESLQDRIM